jgi:hypothetical protein
VIEGGVNSSKWVARRRELKLDLKGLTDLEREVFVQDVYEEGFDPEVMELAVKVRRRQLQALESESSEAGGVYSEECAEINKKLKVIEAEFWRKRFGMYTVEWWKEKKRRRKVVDIGEENACED